METFGTNEAAEVLLSAITLIEAMVLGLEGRGEARRDPSSTFLAASIYFNLHSQYQSGVQDALT